MRRIGVLSGFSEGEPEIKARLIGFRQGLERLAWFEGQNIRIDYRYSPGSSALTQALAKELVALQPNVILAHTTPMVEALQRETRTIPIVFVGITDPVAQGLVSSLAHPGGNLTGFALFEASLGGKWFELLSEIAPGLKRAAIMFNPDTFPISTSMPSFETAARSSRSSDEEIETGGLYAI